MFGYRCRNWEGGVDLRRGGFSLKMYAKTKELGPIGGVRRARPLDPPMNSDKLEILVPCHLCNACAVPYLKTISRTSSSARTEGQAHQAIKHVPCIVNVQNVHRPVCLLALKSSQPLSAYKNVLTYIIKYGTRLKICTIIKETESSRQPLRF